jgi:hypothetical protein
MNLFDYLVQTVPDKWRYLIGTGVDDGAYDTEGGFRSVGFFSNAFMLSIYGSRSNSIYSHFINETTALYTYTDGPAVDTYVTLKCVPNAENSIPKFELVSPGVNTLTVNSVEVSGRDFCGYSPGPTSVPTLAPNLGILIIIMPLVVNLLRCPLLFSIGSSKLS